VADGRREPLNLQPIHRRDGERFEVEGGREEREAARVARAPQLFNEAEYGIVRVFVGFEQQSADVTNEIGESRVARDAATEGEWARAEANEPGLGASLTARDRDACNDVCLPC
jgi:hypothetical protein